MGPRMTHRPPSHDLRRGALFMLASAALFAAMGAGVKLAARELPNAMVVFFRNGVGLAVLLPLLLRKGLRGLHTRDVPGHIVRGLSGLASMYCFFYAIAHLRLADAVLLNQSVPLFIPLVGSLWLGERFPARLWGVIGLGFAGILLILKPGTGLFTPVSLVGVASAVLAAVAQVGIRRLTRTEPVTRIVFYFGLIGSVVSAVPAALAWRDPSPALWGVLLTMGALATAGQLALTRAYGHAPAAQVGPFIYVGPVFAGLLDWWIWETLEAEEFL
ncbi:MAG: EamA family transporter [Acidobacteria bacterium]|nr:MAG: EamA family transporter [Acidobacteriota bacterium]